jgi:hypothetical protein
LYHGGKQYHPDLYTPRDLPANKGKHGNWISTSQSECDQAQATRTIAGDDSRAAVRAKAKNVNNGQLIIVRMSYLGEFTLALQTINEFTKGTYISIKNEHELRVGLSTTGVAPSYVFVPRNCVTK